MLGWSCGNNAKLLILDLPGSYSRFVNRTFNFQRSSDHICELIFKIFLGFFESGFEQISSESDAVFKTQTEVLKAKRFEMQ